MSGIIGTTLLSPTCRPFNPVEGEPLTLISPRKKLQSPGVIYFASVYRIKALLESWPRLQSMNVAKISDSDCRLWAERNARATSSSSHNHTVGILRNIFKIAVEAGARYDNPALAAKRVKERTKKQIKLPETGEFQSIVKEIRKSGNRRYANSSADLVEFLAYGGFRKSS